MIDIIPAILEKNYEGMKNKIALVRGIVPYVQVDFCDGIYVPSKTWPYNTGGFEDNNFLKIIEEQEGMPFWEDIEFEFDMMVVDAVSNFDVYTKLGPKRIIFHIGAVGDLNEFKDFLEGMDVYIRDSIEIGLAIKPSTPFDQIFPLVNYVDFIQIMGNDKIGYQGVTLDENVYEKIKTLREKYLDLPIAVDIGVNEETSPLLVEVGVTKLVAGSMIFRSEDIRETINYLESLK
jgi:ribulose-phosphate 3-epimerase